MDISVELFEVEIDNYKFGLVADLESKSINAQPSTTISFYEPWDGEYYTQKLKITMHWRESLAKASTVANPVR